MSKSTKQSALFEDAFQKPLHVTFDAEGQTSDGGMVILAAADRRLDLTARLADCIHDSRSPGNVRHSVAEMFRQRVFSVAAGYEDGNDAAKLRHDPALAIACGRGVKDAPLASQPSLSRFENSISAKDAVAMGRELEDVALTQLKRQRPKRKNGRRRRIIIDLDPSVDPAHGAQQGVLFHGLYKEWCYLPMFGFLSFEGAESQLLFTARLRPGTSREVRGTIPLVRRIVGKLRDAFGDRQGIVVRLDAGFCYPRLLNALEGLKVQYVVGMGTNPKLGAPGKHLLSDLRRRAERTGEAQRTMIEQQYRTRRWRSERRVITKVEAIPYPGRKTKDNLRHVVTNLRARRESVYALYCLRGDAENRIKELKRDLQVDRTSCSRFVANQVRVLMAAAAQLLYQEIRWRMRHRLGQAQVGRLMMMLVKVGARIVESTRRIVVHLPTNFAFRGEWATAARALGARPG